ncbi:PAS domain-containing sensor histidine kinase [Larkinella soli]|uniref:PAS domain-containing sensor histidine kinase n=1 Tax=Larkinella soli TaxID=1770527 RepID=UPI000FFB6785|nr:PAS domain-containing sensor histidine kinase [Larkinella soli]
MFTDCNLLLQNISEGLMMLDPDGLVTYSNPAVTTMTGFPAEELKKKSLSLLYVNNRDSIKYEYELSQARKKGKFIAEGWKQKKDQTQFWAEMILSAAYDTQGTFIGFTCVLRDISEKKNDHLELMQSEERYRLMVEGVQDYCIFMLDSTGHIVTWNEGARRTKGYSPSEIIGKHFSVFYTLKDLESRKPEMELEVAVATGRYQEEGWRVKKNGSVFWANVVITSLYNEQNELLGFSKVTRDLSERREAEEILRLSEERYRSLVEQVTDYGIFMLDEKGRIISWNEGAKRIKGYSAGEIIGKYFSIFYPKEDLLNGKPAYELKVARAEGKYEEEGWRLRKDGSLFWASIVITAVYNAEGILIGFSKVTRDLTERKQAERELRESYERYRMLAEELRLTNDELSDINQELEQFTSIVSHDLQEPVRTIRSFLQLIELKIAGNQYDELGTYISKSIHAANRMKELIQNLLQYSQLSRKEILQEEISVANLVSQAMQNLKTAIDVSGAEISLESEVETVHGDRVQLVQLVQNLLSNALKFTDTEPPRVVIRCRREKGQVKFAVSDNGIGIEEADLRKVFEIFRRLNTPRNYPGTGIGLAICKKIVDRHRGMIWPESQVGKGTTFYFTLNDEARLPAQNP